MLVDEAHTLDRDVGQLLLNVSQEVRANAPFLLVLAGTPGLPAHLSTMNVSFWSRLDEGRMGIGLLSDAAARDALVKPLTAHGVGIDRDALDAAVADSQCYPYFIQVWGRALWQQRLTTGATRLTVTHVDAARADVAVRATDYYQDRYRELENADLLGAAVATALLFRGATTASDQRSPDTTTTDTSDPPASAATATATRSDVA